MKDYDDALLEISLFDISAAHKKHNDIDSKAIGVITISGLLISFILGFSELNGSISSLFFALTLASFFMTIWLSIRVLKPREAHELSTLGFIDYNEEYDITNLVATAADIEDELQKICLNFSREKLLHGLD